MLFLQQRGGLFVPLLPLLSFDLFTVNLFSPLNTVFRPFYDDNTHPGFDFYVTSIPEVHT